MKRVFLSFRAENKRTVDGLRLVAAHPGHPLEFYDESVTEPYDSFNAEYIKRNIREKISRASVTVCLIDHETYQSRWVAWEIEESLRAGNRIIYMGLPGISGNLYLPYVPHRGVYPGYLWDLQHLFQMIEA